MKISTPFSNAATRTIVAQVGNLPCRRLAAGKAVECGGGCGLSIRDTADCQSALRRQSAFTMVEIAICLAVIGIALISIIGVLPIGMHTQRDNREETIINQDATVFIEAIRGGAQGLDDLTNYVYAISNYWGQYNADGTFTPLTPYGFTNGAPSFLTNGMNIVGLLSTPEYADASSGAPFFSLCFGGISNHIVAYVHSMSGPAIEKPPQDNDIVRNDSFSYRILCVNTPEPMDTNLFFLRPFWQSQIYAVGDQVFYKFAYWSAVISGTPASPPQAGDVPGQSSRWVGLHLAAYDQVLQFATNLRELRLTFLWPQQPNGKLGPGRQTFRTMVAGQIVQTNIVAGQILYFYQSQSFVNTP